MGINLIEKKREIFDFAHDVFNEMISIPKEKRQTDRKFDAVKITIGEVENKKNHIILEFQNIGEDGKVILTHSSSIEYEIKGVKFSVTVEGMEPDENDIFCVAILAFLEKRHTNVVCERIQTAGYKLPQMLKDDRLHHLCELLYMQNWVYVAGNWRVRKLE